MTMHQPSTTSNQLLTAYQQLLLQWNATYNLIGKTTEAELWSRHIEDSAQLYPLLPDTTRTLTDFGSGAGLPVLVLAIFAHSENRPIQFHAIDSVGKKTTFMEHAARTLGLRNITIHQGRIEQLSPWPSDVITARAFAPLEALLEYTAPFQHAETVHLLLKGTQHATEIADAQKKWCFRYEALKTSTDYASHEQGVVLRINAVTRQL